jgi:DNA polymerase III delta subunit
MYVVFYGSDRRSVRDAATKHIDTNMPKDASLTTLDASQYISGQVADALGASSLFGGDEWFVLDSPADNEEFTTELKSCLKELAESTNTFVVLEAVLLAAPKKAYEKYTALATEFSAEKVVRFNAFSLAEALASKDKRKLWVLVQEARLTGSKDEEIVGILWWQLKALRLAAGTRCAAEAGMKDFPYNKAKRSLRIFSVGEVDRISQSLLELYHDGHSGIQDMDSSLEQWVLGL